MLGRWEGTGRGALEEAAAGAVRQAISRDPGDVLCIMPGSGEVLSVLRKLEGSVPQGTILMPLYGDMPEGRQQAALRPLPRGTALPRFPRISSCNASLVSAPHRCNASFHLPALAAPPPSSRGPSHVRHMRPLAHLSVGRRLQA